MRIGKGIPHLTIEDTDGMSGLRLMAVLAHPDDETLGLGGTLARYAAEGVETHVLTATRGQAGRHGPGEHPGREALGRIREAELRAAAADLGVHGVHVLDHMDGELDQVPVERIVGEIAAHLRRVRPQVVLTFGPDGAYGHPDHIAISQFTTAAVTCAADPGWGMRHGAAGSEASHRPHRVSKLYFMAWDEATWALYQQAFRTLTSTVDGVVRQVSPWPEWGITTRIAARPWWRDVWQAVQRHRTQMAIYRALDDLTEEQHRALWGDQTFYRAMSSVNGGRTMETDLFEGVRGEPGTGTEQSTGRTVDGGGSSGSGGMPPTENLRTRRTADQVPIAMDAAAFRQAGHALVDRLAEFLESIPDRPVAPGHTPERVRELLDAGASLPEEGEGPEAALERATGLLTEHSLHIGHPRFFGYVTSSPAPVGMLGDMLAAAINPNMGGWTLSPMATEMEAQAVRWVAELMGYPADCGGLMVSGGNMANMVGLWAARASVGAAWGVRENGMATPEGGALRIYASRETHTWLEKATDLAGLGTGSVRWLEPGGDLRLEPERVREAVRRDQEEGLRPMMVVGTAGTVSTGAVDPLGELAALCREEDIWFHVDGAYGGFAAAAAGVSPDFAAMAEADSVAVDPHKWLYAPLEVGCALVRRPDDLRNAFSYHPPYYFFGQEAINYVDFGPQNSRGFRALKVWLALRQVGRQGYARMIGQDMALARRLRQRVEAHPELEPGPGGLSITTFRYVPEDARAADASTPGGSAEQDTDGARAAGAGTGGTEGATEGSTEGSREAYLNELNQDIQARLEREGEAFVSNAVVRGRYLLRACIVNFNTTADDVDALPEIVAKVGREAHREMKADME